MTNQELLAKLKAYPIASVSLALVVLFGAATYFRWMGVEDLERSHQKIHTEWAKVEENLKNSVNLEAHLAKAQAVTQDAERRLIRPTELARNYQYFYRLESVTGVRIQTLQQQSVQAPPAPPPPPAARTTRGAQAAAPAQVRPNFVRVGYTMTVSGQFRELLHLLHALEHGEHFYHLKSLTLQENPEPETRLLTLTLNFDLLGAP
jgi:hypothetical protein